jgi:lactate permease
VFLILYPAIAISQLMVHSGTVRPGMVTYLSMLLQQTGPWYVLFAPLLGTVGAFITGSTTVSNLVFGAAQLETARVLGADPLAGTRPATLRRFIRQRRLPVQHHCRRLGSQPH